MARDEFYLPGSDGKWDSAALPETLEDTLERIRVLEQALGFYDDRRSYNPDSQDNEYPTHQELLYDQGVTARIGRLATNTDQFSQCTIWAHNQNRRF